MELDDNDFQSSEGLSLDSPGLELFVIHHSSISIHFPLHAFHPMSITEYINSKEDCHIFVVGQGGRQSDQTDVLLSLFKLAEKSLGKPFN